MRRILRIFICLLSAVLFLVSCEEHNTPTWEGSSSITVEQSPIKGVWKCQLNGMQTTLDYGDYTVKNKYHTDLFNATAVYEGTYTIKDNVITHEFTSLTKNSSRVQYVSPAEMPKEAVLQDENTIIYMHYSYKRQ